MADTSLWKRPVASSQPITIRFRGRVVGAPEVCASYVVGVAGSAERHRGRRRAIVVAGVIGAIVMILAGAMAAVYRPWEPPAPGTLGIVTATSDGGFAVMVHLPGNIGFAPWLVSMDGGKTWTKVGGSPSVLLESSQVLRCADDGVCYLAHPRSIHGASVHVVDRLDPNHTWRNEATFGEECRADNLTVDAKDSTRAIVRCAGTTLAYRASGGAWVLVDVGEIARKWW